MDEYAENLIARRLSMVSGVARITVYGAKKYAVRIQADPDKLASRQVDLETLRAAVTSGSINLPAGSLYGQTKAYTVQSNSQLNTASQFAPLIVAYRNGNPVRLDELGRVIDSVTTNRSTFWINGDQSMILAVQKQPGTNTIAVVEGIKDVLPSLRQSIPAGIDIGIEFDASQNIRNSIADVKFTLLLTICLVVLVIFCLPAQRFGHPDSQPRGTALVTGNVRRDEATGLHDRHAIDDGDDAFGRVRGGRRDRDAREHRAAYGNGQAPFAGRL